MTLETLITLGTLAYLALGVIWWVPFGTVMKLQFSGNTAVKIAVVIAIWPLSMVAMAGVALYYRNPNVRRSHQP